MKNSELNGFRNLASAMGLYGNYRVVMNMPNGKRQILAFDLPKERAEAWSKYWPGSRVEKLERIDYAVEINSIHDRAITEAAESLIANEIFEKQPIDRCLQILNNKFQLAISSGQIKIGRGGSHIWISNSANERLAIIYFKD